MCRSTCFYASDAHSLSARFRPVALFLVSGVQAERSRRRDFCSLFGSADWCSKDWWSLEQPVPALSITSLASRSGPTCSRQFLRSQAPLPDVFCDGGRGHNDQAEHHLFRILSSEDLHLRPTGRRGCISGYSNSYFYRQERMGRPLKRLARREIENSK